MEKNKDFKKKIFYKTKFKNIFLFNDNVNKDKKTKIIKITKSSKIMEHNQTYIYQKNKLKIGITKYEEKNSIYQKKIYSNSPCCSKDNSKIINNIQKKITFIPFSSRYSKRNSNDNIFGCLNNNKFKINKNSTNKIKINTSESSINNNRKINIIKNYNLNNSNYKDSKNNHNNDLDIEKILLNINKTSSNKKKYFCSSKFSISLDNILSKNTNKNKNNQKSKEKKKISLTKKNKKKSKFSIYFPLNNPISLTMRNKKDFHCNQMNSKSNIHNKINKRKDTKINIEKNRKIYQCIRQKESKIKDENMAEFLNFVKMTYSTNKLINNGNNNNNNKTKEEKLNQISNLNKFKNKMKKKNNIKKKSNMKEKIFYSPRKTKYEKYKKNDYSNYSRDSSYVLFGENFNTYNEQKILCENNSTNDKTLNTNTKVQDSNKKNNCETPNIIINKYKNSVFNKRNNNYEKKKVKSNLLMDNDELFTFEFDISNEHINKINGVKTNNFDVKKPKEENLKFTFIKDEKESEISVSQASKIIIGNIDGYKDIIETDIKNNANNLSKNFCGVINKRVNLFNNRNNNNNIYGDQEEFSCNDIKKKSCDLSTLLKKEIEPIIFNEYNNIYESFNMTNNIDGISSKITNNIINDNKKQSNISINNIESNNIIEDLNKVSFDISGDNSIINASKFVNYSKIKSNNNSDKITKNNSSNKLKSNNNIVNNQNKVDNLKKIEDVNINCLIF